MLLLLQLQGCVSLLETMRLRVTVQQNMMVRGVCEAAWGHGSCLLP